jgi:two-component system, chemotaxis family, protein-glutamate methylesterase/glutaminase
MDSGVRANVKRSIVVIGTSLGGVGALQVVAKHLSPSWDAACLIVLHRTPNAKSHLAEILSRSAPIPVLMPKDPTPLQGGRIYVAPPDHHMIVQRGVIRLWHGPKENGHRPAVDTLFRSAAQAYGPQVVGVVMTGALDCGTLGLLEIKRLGGTTVVQDPTDAEAPSMPSSALAHVEVDHVAKLSELSRLLVRLTQEERLDVPMSANVSPDAHLKPSDLICPDCGGPLSIGDSGDLTHFKCRTGHRYTIQSLFQEKATRLESALWHALDSLREKAQVARMMARQSRRFRFGPTEGNYEKQAQDADEQAAVIESILTDPDAWRPEKKESG